MNELEIVLDSAVRFAVIIGFAALGELIAQRAGTLNISVEAMMLSGAFGAAYGSTIASSGAVGLLWGIAIGMSVGAVQANASHRFAVNPFVIGLGLNILAIGVTTFLRSAVTLDISRIDRFEVPLLSSIPVIGGPLFGQRWPVLLFYAAVPAVWWLLYRSRFGLEIRAVGEGPQEADVTGIDVQRRRRQAILLCGAMSGLGGAYLCVGEIGAFSNNMTAGRGFLAIAAVIFGGWLLKGAVSGVILFGVADSLRIALPILGLQWNSQLLTASPYVLAFIAMLVFARRLGRQPASLGQQFERGIT
jgi:general nucleoside transport system permease protein